jgi:hypothetical protein
LQAHDLTPQFERARRVSRCRNTASGARRALCLASALQPLPPCPPATRPTHSRAFSLHRYGSLAAHDWSAQPHASWVPKLAPVALYVCDKAAARLPSVCVLARRSWGQRQAAPQLAGERRGPPGAAPPTCRKSAAAQDPLPLGSGPLLELLSWSVKYPQCV